MKTLRIPGATLVALTFGSTFAVAQVPSASAAAFGLAGNYTAAARGYNAVAWNPANLGLGGPVFSISLLSGSGSTGLDPVKLSDFTPFQNKVLPAATKEAWLRSIGSGTERGSVDGGLSLLAVSVGHLAFEAGMMGGGTANLNQDAAEAILFGNAGRTGTAKTLSFNNSKASASMFGTGALSLGIPLIAGDNVHFSAGITGKYIRGLGMARIIDNGSSVAPGAVNVQLPILFTDSTGIGNAGSGFGVDVGLAWSTSATTVSATVRNVMNTFTWSESALRSKTGTLLFDGVTTTSSFDDGPFANAPAFLRAAVQAEKFKPEVAVGLSHRVGSLTLNGDAQMRVGDGIEIGPKMHVGGGAEFTGLPLLTLRAGAAMVTDGYLAAGGVGLHVGHVEIGAAVSTRSRNGGQELGAMVSVLSIR